MCLEAQLVGALILQQDFFVASPLDFSYSASSNFITQKGLFFFPKCTPDSIQQLS